MTTSKRKISITAYLTEKQVKNLKLIHKRTQIPTSIIIREGIDLILKNKESLWDETKKPVSR
jgi:hypothetical protein